MTQPSIIKSVFNLNQHINCKHLFTERHNFATITDDDLIVYYLVTCRKCGYTRDASRLFETKEQLNEFVDNELRFI